MLNTPILFLIFNRPDTTTQVFEAIRQARPRQLFVAADGPRPGVEGEELRCQQARRVATQVDWPCEVKTLFREQNQGCKMAVSSAIDWFFDQVPEGIILEDDTLPNESFFQFCTKLLERYRNNPRVMHISGDNFQNGIRRGDASYYFSAISHIWGWATWKRAWQLYDPHMKSFPAFREGKAIRQRFPEPEIQQFWTCTFERVYQGQVNTWDVQWAYTCLLHNGLAVMPNVNLVANIGFREDATHTTHKDSSNANIPTVELGVIHHPERIRVNREADWYTARHHFNIQFTPVPAGTRSIISSIIRKISRYTG